MVLNGAIAFLVLLVPSVFGAPATHEQALSGGVLISTTFPTISSLELPAGS